MSKVIIVDGVEIDAFEAEVQKSDGGVVFGGRVELDELVVVDLDERLVRNVVLAEIKGLFKAELLVEGDRGGEIVDADCDVGDAVERRRRGIGLCMGEAGKNNQYSKGELYRFADSEVSA